MAEAQPTYRPDLGISRAMKDIGDPANAQYLYEGPNGMKFVDWSNPGHKLERWAERLNVLLSGEAAKIEQCYRDEYYRRLVSSHRLGPDYEQSTEIA